MLVLHCIAAAADIVAAGIVAAGIVAAGVVVAGVAVAWCVSDGMPLVLVDVWHWC